MCNDQEDHVLLGKLCVEMAEVFSGIVNFGEAGEIFAKTAAALSGQRYRLPSMSEGVQLKSDRFFCDAQLTKAWLAHQGFRMVK
jgi:hypothetical protein